MARSRRWELLLAASAIGLLLFVWTRVKQDRVVTDPASVATTIPAAAPRANHAPPVTAIPGIPPNAKLISLDAFKQSLGKTPPATDAAHAASADPCIRHESALKALATSADPFYDVPSDRALHVEAARISRLARTATVLDIEVTSLHRAIADPALIQELGVIPTLLAERIAAEEKKLADARAQLEEERGRAVERGYSMLGDDEGEERVIQALFWRDIESQARQYQDACSRRDSPQKKNVDAFVEATALAADDIVEGHGAIQDRIVSILLREKP